MKHNVSYQPSPDKSRTSYHLNRQSPERKKKELEIQKKLRKDIISFEDKNLTENERMRLSPTREEENQEIDLDKWQPGLDDLPITAQLTRANKEKLAKRDEEIAI